MQATTLVPIMGDILSHSKYQLAAIYAPYLIIPVGDTVHCRILLHTAVFGFLTGGTIMHALSDG